MILFADLTCGLDEGRLLSALVDLGEKTDRAPLKAVQAKLAPAFPDVRATLMHVNTLEPPAARLQLRVMPAGTRTAGAAVTGDAAMMAVSPDAASASAASDTFDALDASDAVKDHARSVLRRLLDVGAGTPGRDKLFCIAGVAVLLDMLEVESLFVTPLSLGGAITAEAEAMPEVLQSASVSRSAIAQILCRAASPIPMVTGPLSAELSSPAGAALIAEYVTSSEPMPPCAPVACGYGTSGRTLKDGSDLVRLIFGQDASPSEFHLEQVCLLETNIDHISAEAIAFAADEAMKKGALDAWQEAITMKKGRLGTLLSVLCKPSDADRLCGVIHASTGTLGIRRRLIMRSVVERRELVFPTPYGDVRFKAGVPHDSAGDDSETRWLRAESDDIARIAHETGRGYDAVKKELFGQATAQIQMQKAAEKPQCE